MQYWLLKTEPSCYSIDDLKRERVGVWDDIRNYQARNFLRAMQKGDRVLVYHSSTEMIGVVGTGVVARTAYPDPSQFDHDSYKFDPKSKKENPTWDTVDIKFEKKFPRMVTLQSIKNDPYFTDMLVTKKGMRLSVQPVLEKHFSRLYELGTEKI